jgi:starch synthase
VILGKGDQKYEEFFHWAAQQYPGRMTVKLDYNEALSMAIYSGADLFLMPSKSEPCGLSQMIAMRYGTVPIVRETGGLKDTVHAYEAWRDSGNGFSFSNYASSDMLHVIREAVELYKDSPDAFARLRTRAMSGDFSWSRSAKDYLRMYANITGQVLPVAEESEADRPFEDVPPAEEAEKPVKKTRKTTTKKTAATAKKTVKKAAETVENLAEKAEKPVKKAVKKVAKKAEEVVDTVEALAELAEEPTKKAVEIVAEKAEEVVEKVTEKAEEVAELVAEKAEEVTEKLAAKKTTRRTAKKTAEAAGEAAEKPAKRTRKTAAKKEETAEETAEKPVKKAAAKKSAAKKETTKKGPAKSEEQDAAE